MLRRQAQHKKADACHDVERGIRQRCAHKGGQRDMGGVGAAEDGDTQKQMSGRIHALPQCGVGLVEILRRQNTMNLAPDEFAHVAGDAFPERTLQFFADNIADQFAQRFLVHLRLV